LIIDPKIDPCVDIATDAAATGCFTDWQTIVMIRYLLGGDKKQTEKKRLIRRGLCDIITFHNALVRDGWEVCEQSELLVEILGKCMQLEEGCT
jgi:hypothetical protein